MKSRIIESPKKETKNSVTLETVMKSYLQGKLSEADLQKKAAETRKANWSLQSKNGMSFISSNDFSFYDTVLDTAVLLNIIPARYKALNTTDLETYFAMAKGYKKDSVDIKALMSKKCSDTHCCIVPEIEDNTEIRLTGTKLFDEYLEAKALGFETKPVILGPYTLIRLAERTGSKTVEDCIPELRRAYSDLLIRLNLLGALWIQFDEPALTVDMDNEDIDLFCRLYDFILTDKGNVKVLLQTYFGNIGACYAYVADMPFDGIGFDFCKDNHALTLIQENGFPQDKTLFVVVDTKKDGKTNTTQTLKVLKSLKACTKDVVINTPIVFGHAAPKKF